VPHPQLRKIDQTVVYAQGWQGVERRLCHASPMSSANVDRVRSIFADWERALAALGLE
jgi:hypothetical protein